MTKDTIVPISLCLRCGHAMDRASAVIGRAVPEPGDLTLCIRCGHGMAFDEDMHLRNLTLTESVDLAFDPVVKEARQLIVEGNRLFPLRERTRQ